MAKFTYKEIKEIIENTPAELSGKDFPEISRHNYIDLGAFWKQGANWCYQVKAIVWDGCPQLVVVVFGKIQ